MSYLTIPSGIKDPSYRYKMQKMVLKQESRLNGVKTNISNLEDVAGDLRVPSSAILKFMCAELGANSEGTSIIKGSHTDKVMLEKLDKFIHMYICCPNCKLPEIKHFVQGKNDLKSKCNSCGKVNGHNGMHKSGKALINHLKQGGEQITDIQAHDNRNAEVVEKKKDKKDKKSKKKSKNKDEEEEEEKEESDNEDDIVSENDEELTWQSRRINKSVQMVSSVDVTDNDELFSKLQEVQKVFDMDPEFLQFIALVAVFPPKRNIIKNWQINQGLFLKLVKSTGKVGKDHFLQALVLYFIRKYSSELSKFAETFMKKLIDESFISEKFLIDWNDKTIRLDKDSGLYDKKAEKKFRDLIEKFMEWLKNAESSSGSSDSESEKEQQEQEEEEKESVPDKKAPAEETAAQKKQREMIEKQKKAQAEAMKALEQEEEKKLEIIAEQENTGERINLTELNNNEEVDIDDI